MVMLTTNLEEYRSLGQIQPKISMNSNTMFEFHLMILQLQAKTLS